MAHSWRIRIPDCATLTQSTQPLWHGRTNARDTAYVAEPKAELSTDTPNEIQDGTPGTTCLSSGTSSCPNESSGAESAALTLVLSGCAVLDYQGVAGSNMIESPSQHI